MKFRNKILFAIWSVVLGLIILTFIIINYWMRVQVQNRFSDDLLRGRSTLHEITRLRSEQDIQSCGIIAETPGVKAVAGIGDSATAIQHAKELNRGIFANLFIITDTVGHPLVRLIDSSVSDFPTAAFSTILQALNKRPGTDVRYIGTEVFRLASAPIIVGSDCIGTLTIGFRIKPEDVEFVKGLTNSEVILAADTRQVFSTIAMNESSATSGVLGNHIRPGHRPESDLSVFQFAADGSSFVGLFFRLNDDRTADPPIGYLLVKPIDREVAATLNPVLNTLVVLSVIVLIITAIIGYLISKSITKPIAALVQGTTEVSRGNYDIRIDVRSGGELGFLAQKFEEMGITLKEKIHQLSEQNVELQTTLRELRATEEERLRLSTNLHLLLESTGEGIYGVDTLGSCTFINRAAAQMLGYSPDQIIGKNIHDLTHHTHPDGSPYHSADCPITTVIKTGKGCRIDGEMMWRSDRSALPVEYSSSPILVDGTIRGAVVAFTDITERRTLQQRLLQTQKIESIGRLAGGIAHDFNNILTIIIGHATVLNRFPAESPKREESVAAIKKASQRGAGLVKQLLTFARKTDIVLESVRINELITEVVALINETFPKTIIMSLQLENNLSTIIADANQLHQVLVNLCVNARDAMPGGGRLSLSTHQIPFDRMPAKFSKASATDYIEIIIGDTGTGMDEQTMSRIFEPFFTTKEVGKGTGLGLAVVFGIVETHKGYIDVDSTPGKGTTFHLYFPVQPKTVEAGANSEERLEEITGGTDTILFVEDEEMLRDLIREVLTAKGYTVLTAEDGEEMINTYLRHQREISLVISDMGLPKLGGYEAYKKIKAVTPQVRMILASGYLEPNVKSEIFKGGVKDFIQKPYLPDEVLKKVRDALSIR